jgi:hypothetical protein
MFRTEIIARSAGIAHAAAARCLYGDEKNIVDEVLKDMQAIKCQRQDEGPAQHRRKGTGIG